VSDRHPWFLPSVAYWTALDPPYVESDCESEAESDDDVFQRVSDRLGGNGQNRLNETRGNS
jgi:hypothetical protein